jgi:hypothetical protein
MVYISQEDLDIQTGDDVLRQAWSDRRHLRIKYLELQNEIKALDAFIETYIYRANPVYKNGAQLCTTWTFTQNPETVSTPTSSDAGVKSES